jgi:RIO kinase 1
MRIPDSLVTLHDQGIITEVHRPLMSGKEAQIYLVTSAQTLCVAKVYKEAQNRSFKHRADYTEGRKVRNSRDQRAMAKRSKHGREQEEAAWRSTEVDVIYRLHSGGVRVPKPYQFIDGVLVMELVTDADGMPAPRLGDISFEPETATAIYEHLIREVVRMLCVGVVHGDLSDFNVLLGADGPVIIDFPQSVDSAHNNNARQLLIRDVNNLHDFLKRFVPNARRLPYAEEMWDLHQNNALTPDTQLTGRYRSAQRHANVGRVLDLIADANHDERKRRDALGQRGGPPAREVQSHRGQPQNTFGAGRQPRNIPPHRGEPQNTKGASSQQPSVPQTSARRRPGPNPGVIQLPNAGRRGSNPQQAAGQKGRTNIEVIVLRKPVR